MTLEEIRVAADNIHQAIRDDTAARAEATAEMIAVARECIETQRQIARELNVLGVVFKGLSEQLAAREVSDE